VIALAFEDKCYTGIGSLEEIVTGETVEIGNAASDIADLKVIKENKSEKDAASGYAGLTGSSQILATALPLLDSKGDLLSRDASANLKLGVGTDGQVLTADSGETSGLIWTTPAAAGNITTTAVSANYTALSTDHLILMTTGATDKTVTLPASTDGKEFIIKKVDGAAGRCIVETTGAGSEAIDSDIWSGKYFLNGLDSAVSIIGDGTQYWIDSNIIPDFFRADSAGLINYTITAGQFGDLTSIVVEPGEFDFTAQATFKANGAVTTGAIEFGISTTSGNSGAGLVLGVSSQAITKTTASGTFDTVNIAGLFVVNTVTTTYFLKCFASTSITNLQVAFQIFTRRVY